jgi:hypothetical protein
MLGDPRDRAAYRIAIASLGLALAIALTGVCTIQAIGKHVPQELWFICSAAAGLLAGTLIPFSLRNTASTANATQSSSNTPLVSPEGALALLVLAGAVAAVCFGETVTAQMLGVALGGFVFGLLVPSPSRWDR